MAKKLSDMDKKAAMKALNDYRGEAQRLMKDKMNGLKKKSAPESEESSLDEAYSEAEMLLDGEDMDSEECEDMESEDMMDEADLDKQIEKLMLKKKMMKMGK